MSVLGGLYSLTIIKMDLLKLHQRDRGTTTSMVMLTNHFQGIPYFFGLKPLTSR